MCKNLKIFLDTIFSINFENEHSRDIGYLNSLSFFLFSSISFSSILFHILFNLILCFHLLLSYLIL